MDVNLGLFEIIQLSVQHLSTQDSVNAQLVPPGPPAPALEAGSVPQVVLTSILRPPEAIAHGTLSVGSQYEVILRPVTPVAR